MTRALKILLVADGHAADIYVGAFHDGFKKLGHTVQLFTWKEYFHHYPYANVYPTKRNPLASIYYRAQNKFTVGPALHRLNANLLTQAKTFKPNLVFVYRGTHIFPRTLKALKRSGAKVFGYNNDDPFSAQYPAYFWRHFKRGISSYDHLFAYRQKNLADYHHLGYTTTSLLRSYYVAAKNFPLKNARKTTAVTFIGHYENDGRDSAIQLLRNNGIKVQVFGTGWEKSILGPAKALYGASYNQAINRAKIALSFLSKLNNDTYTRRSFEIPAAATCMVSEYSADLAHNLFKPNVEAVYFTNPNQLLKQVKKLLASPAHIQKIARAGHARLMRDGHEATDRCKQVIATLNAF